MKKILILAPVIAIASGCVSLPPTATTKATLNKNRGVCIQENPQVFMKQADDAIGKSFSNHGFSVNESGSCYKVTYTAHWGWDIAMYVRSFTIKMSDGDRLISVAEYKNGMFHEFNQTANIVDRLVAQLVSGAVSENIQIAEKPKEQNTKKLGCTTQQILDMKRTGLTDDRIKAACN